MIIFENTFGIIFQVIVYISILVLVKYKFKKNNFTYKSSLVILYISFCTTLFITIWYLEGIFFTSDKFIFTENGYQFSLILISLSLIFQFIVVIVIPDLFYKMIVPAFINLLSSYSILFFIKFSIISSVWFIIFTGALVGFIFLAFVFESIKAVLEQVEKINSKDGKKEILESIKEDQNRFFRISFQALLALAASIGVSMSILFQGGTIKWEDQTVIIAAINTVLAFSMILFGFLIWMVKPYLSNFLKVRFYYKDLNNQNSIIVTKYNLFKKNV